MERRDSGIPEDGISHRYSSPPSERWTTYFYQPDNESLKGSTEQRLDAQLEVFKQVVQYRRSQGAFDAYEIAVEAPDPIPVSGTTLPGRKLAYIFRKGEATYVSLLFLYAVRDGYVKIRGTIDSAAWDLAQSTFPRDFIRALVSENQPI